MGENYILKTSKSTIRPGECQSGYGRASAGGRLSASDAECEVPSVGASGISVGESIILVFGREISMVQRTTIAGDEAFA